MRFTMYIYYLIFSHLFPPGTASPALLLPSVRSTENRARTHFSIKKNKERRYKDERWNDVKIEKQTHVTFCCCDASSLDIARTNSITHSIRRWNKVRENQTNFLMRYIHSFWIVTCSAYISMFPPHIEWVTYSKKRAAHKKNTPK